jgi:hypothetical protein
VTTRRIVTRDTLAAATRERFGQNGAPRLRRLLNLTRTGAVSASEIRVHTLLRQAGVAGWVANAAITVHGRVIAVVDLLFEQERVVIEIDGLRAHSGREAFVRDRRRQNALVACGYLVLRFTW